MVESVIDGVVDELAELGVDLAAASDPVAVPRPPSRTRMSERTRAMSWRIARIDWHLTYLDTGRAGGWPATTSVTPDGTGSVADLVPWTVALAIAEGERAGLVDRDPHLLSGPRRRPDRRHARRFGHPGRS